MARPDEPTNILLITVDDLIAVWRFKTAFGAPLHTPHLDRICEKSAVFTSAYTQIPDCDAARAVLVTGQAPHTSGVTRGGIPVLEKIDAADTWPAKLSAAGYVSFLAGKTIQSDSGSAALYGDVAKAPENPVRLPPRKRICFGGAFRGQATPDVAKHDSWFHDHVVTRAATRFLRQHLSNEPFFLEVGFAGARAPWITPYRFKAMYDAEAFRLPETWVQNPRMGAFKGQPTAETLDWWRKTLRNYASAISHVDEHLGRFWDAFRLTHHSENTVVIITSDHGLHMGGPVRFRKPSIREQNLNVPLIVYDPRQPTPRVIPDPVGLIDIGPTVMDYAGLPPLQDVPGTSLRRYVGGLKFAGRVIPSVWGRAVTVRRGRYRLTRMGTGACALHDIEADPWQTCDLGTDHPKFEAMARSYDKTASVFGFAPMFGSGPKD